MSVTPDFNLESTASKVVIDEPAIIELANIDKKTTTFAEAMNIEPTAIDTRAVGHVYRLSLSQNGTHLGWLGQDSNQWARLVNQAEALFLEWFPYSGVSYYRISGTNRYMSVSGNAYVGFYSWSGATGFTAHESRLRSDYNHQDLSYHSQENGYLTCWDKYTPLDVGFYKV